MIAYSHTIKAIWTDFKFGTKADDIIWLEVSVRNDFETWQKKDCCCSWSHKMEACGVSNQNAPCKLYVHLVVKVF